MQSKTTVSRIRKTDLLKRVQSEILDILIHAKKTELSFVPMWELKNVTKKVNQWHETIFPKDKSITE